MAGEGTDFVVETSTAGGRRTVAPRKVSVFQDLGVWLAIAAFAPYLIKSVGLRAEHVAAYVAGSVGVLRLLGSRIRRPTYAGPILAFFGLAAMWAIGVTLAMPRFEADTFSVVSDADHYVRPLMLAIGIVAWIDHDFRHTALVSLRRVCLVLLAALSFSAILAALAVFMDVGGITAWFRPISTLENPNVADLAVAGGRFTGVFNQPFEAGVAYSLGLLGWGYLFSGRQAERPNAVAYVGLTLVVLGGLLPVSKAFIFGGVPLFLVYWLTTGGLGDVLRLRTLPAVALGIYAIARVVANWSGSDLLQSHYQDTVSGERSLVSALTAGRFGEEGLVSSAFAEAVQGAPLTGFGLASYGPLDNAYFMYFIHGGTLPLLGYLLLLGWLAMQGIRHASGTREGRLLVLLVLYMVGASLGAPIASIPRASTALWIVIVLLLIAIGAGHDREIVQQPRHAEELVSGRQPKPGPMG